MSEPERKKMKPVTNGNSSSTQDEYDPCSQNTETDDQDHDQAMEFTQEDQDDVNDANGNRGYRILSAETIFDNVMKLVHQSNEIIKLPTSTVMILLNHVKWDGDRLLEAFYGDKEKLLKDANVIIPPEDPTDVSNFSTSSKDFECSICLDTVPNEQTSTMLCGHRFCKICWTSYLQNQVTSEGLSQTISCPATNCPIFVEYDMVTAHVTDEAVIKKYHQLVAKNFVESNRRLCWCPTPGCNNAVSIDILKWTAVECSCGNIFCFTCGKDWHEPVRCDILAKWLKKLGDDSETATWIQANTKDCPKCNTMIEKNGGCNHMTCRMPSCRYEFCWICMQDWLSHTSGNAYSCNRFDESKNTDAGEARIALKRYLHYHDRYMNHMQSLKFETKLKDTVADKMDIFQKELKMSWVDVQFFQTAADTLCRCRKTLLYTYCFAFFLAKSNQSEIFEDNQRDLESATEALSGYLENDLSFTEKTVVVDGVPKVDPVKIKLKIVNSSAYCESRRLILNQHVLDGYDEDSWTYRDPPNIQTTQQA